MTEKADSALWQKSQMEVAAQVGSGSGGGDEAASLRVALTAATQRAAAAEAAAATAGRASAGGDRDSELVQAGFENQQPCCATPERPPRHSPALVPPGAQARRDVDCMREDRDKAVAALRTALVELKAGAAAVSAQRASAEAAERAMAEAAAKGRALAAVEAALLAERAAKRTIINKAGMAVKSLQKQLEEAGGGAQAR